MCCTGWNSPRPRRRLPRAKARRKKPRKFLPKPSSWRSARCSGAGFSGFIRRAACTNFPRRKRCWTWIFRSPFTWWWTGSRSIPRCVRGWWIRWKSAIAKGAARRFSNSCRRLRAARANGWCSTSDSSARRAARRTRNPSRACSRSTIRMGPARAARGSATRSTSTSIW